jgi:hypothetical protein
MALFISGYRPVRSSRYTVFPQNLPNVMNLDGRVSHYTRVGYNVIDLLPPNNISMNGLLIPSWYKQEAIPQSSLTLVTFLFGFSSACAVFTATTIVSQAYRISHRSKRLFTHPYVLMITAVWLASVVYSFISYLFIREVIPPRYLPSSARHMPVDPDNALTPEPAVSGCSLPFVSAPDPTLLLYSLKFCAKDQAPII